MLKLIRENLLVPIHVSAEVQAALKENTLVLVEKRDISGESPDYRIYACKGRVEGGKIVED